MESLIVSELSKFKSSDFYFSDKIPTEKLRNAISHYPVDKTDKVIALVDSTVFGSAKNGMAIGIKGLYWKNDWTTETIKNFISWDEISINYLKSHKMNLVIAPGCLFNMTGCSVKPAQLVDILLSIINSSRKNINLTQNNEAGHIEKLSENSKNNTEVNDEKKSHRFEGNYDNNLLKSVKNIASKYRLPKSVYIAPSISVNKVQTILDICKDNIDPYSIFIIVDNTFLQTGKDFIIITKNAIYSKAMLRNLDKFNINEIRSIHSKEKEFYINNHDFQFLDQLSESEVNVFVDFLHELIPFLQKTENNQSRSTSTTKNTPTILHTCGKESFELAHEAFIDELNQEDDPEINEFADGIFRLLKDSFESIIDNYSEDYFCGKDYLFHQCLLAFSVSIPCAYYVTSSEDTRNELTSIVMAAVAISLACLVEVGTNKYEFYTKYEVEKYHSIIKDSLMLIQRTDDILHTINSIKKTNNSPEDKKAIQLAQDALPIIIKVFQSD